ncbi:hypothetical protein [Luteococcus japonicus]|uniref:Uncharacterized protein n=1 Tax=Luteococcus japonicus LSP_Lj1 TaxID=1255658 RepID=A0A1R4IZV2_9ACTN|nr:hypothetical protein [Luteococcus japonicus]SJN24933.1 hypothetical protein FM114_04495 [Luteococcus japonicus LSP_Lj1]
MSRSTALRTSIAALAVLPAFTACSMLPGGQEVEANPNQATPAVEESTDNGSNDGNNSNNNNKSSSDESQDSNDDQDSNDNSSSNSSEDSNNNSGDDDSNNDGNGSDSNSRNNSGDDDSQDGSSMSGDSSSNSGSNSSNSSNSGSSTGGDSNSNSTSNSGSNGSSSNSGSSNGSGSASSAGQQVPVPAGSGISNLEVVKLQGSATTRTRGMVVGVFKATTDRPMSLKLRVKLYDANGKQIASNDGSNSVYTTGTHDLVTTNYFALPAGAKPKTFKVSLVDKTDLRTGFSITQMGRPTVGKYLQNRGVQSLKGTATSPTAVKGSVTIKAACISGGKVYQGTDSLSNNARENGKIAYDIPIYDAKGVDLTKATCYVSA